MYSKIQLIVKQNFFNFVKERRNEDILSAPMIIKHSLSRNCLEYHALFDEHDPRTRII